VPRNVYRLKRQEVSSDYTRIVSSFSIRLEIKIAFLSDLFKIASLLTLTYDAPRIRAFRGHTESPGRLGHFAARIGSIFRSLKQPKNENASRDSSDCTDRARCSRTRDPRETESAGRWCRGRPG